MSEEERIRKMLSDETAFAQMLEVAMRENRACWIWQQNMQAIFAVRQARAWLGGAALPPPVTMVSTMLRPGDDNDLKWTHMRMAFARAAVSGGKTDTYNFLVMKVTDYMLVNELEAIARTPLTEEMRTSLDDFYSYQERSRRNRHAQGVVQETLERKARGYSELMRKLSDDFRQRERALLGDTMMTAADQAMANRLDVLTRDVAAIARRTHTPPASSTTQQWVLAQWTYYVKHPEAVKGAQERKRVYVRDVWETVRDEAKARGIATFKDFRTVLRTAQQGLRRATEP